MNAASRSTPLPFAAGATTSTLAPARAPRVDRAGVGRIGGDDERRPERGIEQRPVGRDPAASVEHHPQRRARRRAGDVAHGQRGPVGERGARADDDRLRVGAQLVRVRRARRREVIHCDEPSAAATRPSRLSATFATTNARPVRR